MTSGENPENLFSETTKPSSILIKDQNTLLNFKVIYDEALSNSSNSVVMNVLYIDDDKFVQKMIKLWLGKVENLNLDICGSIAELQKFKNGPYDIIVSDNLLGDGEFPDIIKNIQSSALKDTPVIVYTGSISKLKIDELKQMGNVLDILPKPFEMKNFMKKLESIKKLKSK